MAINFPDAPSVNDTYVVDDKTFVWTGDYWRVYTAASSIDTLIKDADNDTKVTVEQSADEDTVRIFTAGTERYSIASDGHIIPTANETYDLGSATNRFRDLYLSGTSINLGGMVISTDGTSLSMTPTGGAPADPVATESYVDTAITDLVGGAPLALDTLNELAAALNDDASYATTITNALALKLDSSSYTAADVLAKILTVDGASSGLDADTLDGSHASAFAASSHTHSYLPTAGGTVTGDLTVDGQLIANNWLRTSGEEGLYSQSYGQHFYPDSGGFYWDIDGPLRVRSGYEGGIQGYLGYHDVNGFGLLHSGGSWWLNTQNNFKHLTIGGSQQYNAYNSQTGMRLMFSGGNADAQGNYYIGTNLENYGGNYNKLDVFWHTGVRIAAMRQYGGIRMYGSITGGSLSDELFSVGKGDGNVRATNAIYSGQGFRLLNPTSGDGDDYAVGVMNSDWNAWADIFSASWIGASNGWGTFWAGSSGALYRRVSSDTNPNEFVFVGSGQKRFTFELNTGGPAFFDGTLTQNAYDYAEYFEWEDGNPDGEDRRGISVVLSGEGYIRPATDTDDPEDIIGVISGTAAVLGDAAIYDWQGKYQVDEWGTLITEEVNQVSWCERDESGGIVQRHSYDEDQIPEGLTVPEDASYHLYERGVLSPDYDPNADYLPRDLRSEWGVVGLLGKVRVRDDSPKNPRWRYLRTVQGKELWLIR